MNISIELASTCFTIGIVLNGGCGSKASRSPAPASSVSAQLMPPPTSAADCEALWTRFHAKAPKVPNSEHELFVARCGRSERAVLTCPERVLADAADRMRKSAEMMSEAKIQSADGTISTPAAEPVTDAELARFSAEYLPSRMELCMARERLLFAQRSGELDALAKDVAASKWKISKDGVVVVDGTYATLPSQGYIELGGRDGSGPAPPGEVRVRTTEDGRVWLYFLGLLLGRHQNQSGFVFSSGPFVPGDFEREDATHESICIGAGDEYSGAKKGERYLLPCFRVGPHHSPQLIEVGAAPD